MPQNPPGPSNPRHPKYDKLKIGLSDTVSWFAESAVGGTPENPPGPSNPRHPKYNDLKVGLVNTIIWWAEEQAEEGDPAATAIVEAINGFMVPQDKGRPDHPGEDRPEATIGAEG